ncbi:SARP family transcriptional regulator [Amycolatopsis mediterranei S699]|uniref:SARP family transcriptional regulator n=3 Tax=Amycolatopsis mediterranei TaxID=33910 RepID=A0A0H3DDH3_AMYMU|nr:BTAD domain-containing putative transcriptional regulator [Amycolatopsis mediterranei]ADJ48123.1 SARP family transcriptional regulator [Amycolatopsis mediterranei U32]AEK45024.1 SARP family transcriptional regulator [Amycolatopsis mediterranei S699]AFO79834.1 SARP family transcriptional regulator [Amycolatopsis mediterranei S699]KDO10608.1 SARP family transcriptional regulator [Amycolatopsis mediterranei]KDU87070.1 SARP family transcriptional regulator [Amycolatopsis mediterranei]
MEFRLLGSMAVLVAGEQVPLGGPKPRTLLAVLLVNAGRVVPVDTLITALWGENPPNSARSVVHTYVSALRRMLGDRDDALRRQAPGYLLDVAPESIDLVRFERVVSAGCRALAAGDAQRASATLTEALGLWSGPPLGGAEGEWAETERTKLAEARLVAVEARLEADFRLGRAGALTGELTELVAEHPLREPLRAKLILALHQAGRQADALATFHQARRLLDDELGVEPGPQLQAAFQTVLAEPAGEAAAPAATLRPSLLPATISDFTGRREDVDHVLRGLRPAGSAARVCAVSGKPGSGKTTLAVHAAHRIRDQYPDGQLYATLHGNHPEPADPDEVLARFLHALGVADAAIPGEPAERVDLYRSLLADRRVLVVLDDAAGEKQVRPLLPPGGGCAVLVTSRVRLAALEGAALVDLHELREEETLELLAKLVGPRLAAEPEAALEIVRLCGHLPLAVRIAGARLAARPDWTLARLAQRLGRKQRLLNELVLGDLEVRGSLAVSYDGLGEQERAALRRLGMTGVQDFAGWLAAPLLDVPVAEAEDVIERLVDAQLLDPAGADVTGLSRYRIHDLTRAYAVELCDAEEPAGEVRAALDRVGRDALTLVRSASGRTPSPEGSGRLDHATVEGVRTDPDAWFEAEEELLVGVVERAGELDLVPTAAALASALSSSTFAARNQFRQWQRTHTAALAAAQRAGDRAAEGLLLNGMGTLYFEQDRFDESLAYYHQALAAFEEVGDCLGQARTWLSLSFVLRERGSFADAERALTEAVPVLRSEGTDEELAQAEHNLGMILTESGDLSRAADSVAKALAHWRASGNRRGAALALRSTGIIHRAAGRLTEAADCCARAAAELRIVGSRLVIAYADQALAKVRIRQGRGEEVRASLEEALITCNELQDGFGQALVLRTLGELDLATGAPAAATAHLTRSLEWWQALDLPVWQARTHRDLAVAAALSGDERRAIALRDKARAVFERYGCREATEPLPLPSPPHASHRVR